MQRSEHGPDDLESVRLQMLTRSRCTQGKYGNGVGVRGHLKLLGGSHTTKAFLCDETPRVCKHVQVQVPHSLSSSRIRLGISESSYVREWSTGEKIPIVCATECPALRTRKRLS